MIGLVRPSELPNLKCQCVTLGVQRLSHTPFRIVPASAHAAFDKGAAYLKIKLHTIPVDPITRQVDLARVKRAM